MRRNLRWTHPNPAATFKFMVSRSFLIFLTVLTLAACASQNIENKQRANLHLQIGTGFLAQGQYPKALSELLKAEELDPQNVVVLNNLGLTYFVRGKSKMAEDKFRAAIKIAPNFTEGKNNLARVLIETNRANEAIKILHEAEGDLTFDTPEKTLSNLGLAYFTVGQYVKAEDYLSRSLQVRREDCVTADYYGRTLLELKRTTQSAEALDQAIEYCREARFDEPIYFSAMSYFSIGNKEKSRARLQELLKDYPKSKYALKSKGMLELLEQ